MRSYCCPRELKDYGASAAHLDIVRTSTGTETHTYGGVPGRRRRLPWSRERYLARRRVTQNVHPRGLVIDHIEPPTEN